MQRYIPQGKGNLSIDKIGITLEELKKMKNLPGSSNSLLNDISKQLIIHSEAKRWVPQDFFTKLILKKSYRLLRKSFQPMITVIFKKITAITSSINNPCNLSFIISVIKGGAFVTP